MVIYGDNVEHDIEVGDDIEEDTEGDINLWTNRELESRVFLPEKCQNHKKLLFYGNHDYVDNEDDDDDLSGGGEEADCVEARSSSWYQGSLSVTFRNGRMKAKLILLAIVPNIWQR